MCFLIVEIDLDEPDRDTPKRPIYMKKDQYLRVLARSLFYIWSVVCVTWHEVYVAYMLK